MEKFIQELSSKYNLKKELSDHLQETYQECRHIWGNINDITACNQLKILQAFQENRTGDFHLHGSTGYGYGDTGREVLEDIWADIFKSEKALVRPQIASGTHAIALCLYGVLKPHDEFISISGLPYDTLQKVIGSQGETGTLSELNIIHKIIDLKEDGDFDYQKIRETITPKTKMICIQRSRGYSWRASLTINQISEAISFIKKINPDIICFVDNCYGEFVELEEPTQVGADLVAGSLIKNPGGGITPRGGYIVGKEKLVYQAACRLTAPGIADAVGSALDFNRPAFQGLFLAPLIVEQALKGAIFTSLLFSKLGYQVSPKPTEIRTDIIQAIKLGSAEAMRAFSRGIQKASPLDSYVTPEESLLPGYEDPVIMAGGTFIQGSSIELSVDGPLREPYIIYLQGGLSLSHVLIGAVSAVSELGCV